MTSDTNPDLGDRAGENRNEPFATTAPETAAEIPPSAVPAETPVSTGKGEEESDGGMETVVRFYVLHEYRSGKGGALAMSLSPARPGHSGSLVVSLAPQGRDPAPEETPAFRSKKQFVWSQRLNFRLAPVEVVQMLRVLRGTLPAVGADGRGWIHGKYTRIEVARVEDGGRSAVRISAGRTMPDGSRRFAWVYLDADESAVLLLSLQQTLPVLVFGVPVAPPAPVFAPPPFVSPAAPPDSAAAAEPLPEW